MRECNINQHLEVDPAFSSEIAYRFQGLKESFSFNLLFGLMVKK